MASKTPQQQTSINIPLAFALLLSGDSYKVAADKLQVRKQTLENYASRHSWPSLFKAARQQLAEVQAAQEPTPDLDHAAYQAFELRKLKDREDRLQCELQAIPTGSDTESMVSIMRELDRIAERRRVVLGIPAPATERRSRVKRGNGAVGQVLPVSLPAPNGPLDEGSEGVGR